LRAFCLLGVLRNSRPGSLEGWRVEIDGDLATDRVEGSIGHLLSSHLGPDGMLHDGNWVVLAYDSMSTKTVIDYINLLCEESGAACTDPGLAIAFQGIPADQMPIGMKHDCCSVTTIQTRKEHRLARDDLPRAILVSEGEIRGIASPALSSMPSVFLGGTSRIGLAFEGTDQRVNKTACSECDVRKFTITRLAPEKSFPQGSTALCRYRIQAPPHFHQAKERVLLKVEHRTSPLVTRTLKRSNGFSMLGQDEWLLTVGVPITRQGVNAMEVFISSEDGKYRQPIQVQANGFGKISVEPRIIDFGDVSRGESKAKLFSMRSDYPTQMPYPHYNRGSMVVGKASKVQSLSDRDVSYSVVLDDQLGFGFLNDRISIKSGDPDILIGDIYVRARICGDYRVSPSQLDFGVGTPGEARGFVLTLSRSHNKQIDTDISIAASCEDPSVELDGADRIAIKGRFVFPDKYGLVKNKVIVHKSADLTEPQVTIPFLAVVVPENRAASN